MNPKFEMKHWLAMAAIGVILSMTFFCCGGMALTFNMLTTDRWGGEPQGADRTIGKPLRILRTTEQANRDRQLEEEEILRRYQTPSFVPLDEPSRHITSPPKRNPR